MQRPEDTLNAIDRIYGKLDAIAARHATRGRALELELADELAEVKQNLSDLMELLRP